MLSRLRARARTAPRDLSRWSTIVGSRRAVGGPRVYYGRDRVPARDAVAHGGTIKLQSLDDSFPNAPREFNVLYLASSALPHDARVLVRLARRRRAVFVWNQDGVAYPAWHGPGWERVNDRLGRLLHDADHVVYQSHFCKLSADRFCGERSEGWEVLYNPVDTQRFVPARARPNGRTLLLGGNQYQRYRFETALQTLVRLPGWRLLVTGDLSWSPDRSRSRREGRALIAELGLADRVELSGPYTQTAAPALISRADVLLHTKVNDPCPTIVLEAMACGLPVVYSGSGGTPELVGDEAGVGLPATLDWERERPPGSEELAAAVEDVSARLDELRHAARARAEHFDVRRWIARHRQIFERLAA